MTASRTRKAQAELRKYIRSLPATLKEVDLAGRATPEHLKRAWRSRHFTAQLFDEPNGLRLSVQRSEDAPPVRGGRERPISWDELMEVKRQVGFGDRWAVEIFPPDDQVVDVAPMRHLWVLPGEPDYGWRSASAQPVESLR